MSKNEEDDGDLTIRFDNRKAAMHFKAWLAGQGEQDYWIWMECREQEEDGPITATRFDCSSDEPVIGTKCGRLSG